MGVRENCADVSEMLGLLENILFEADRASQSGTVSQQIVQIMFRYTHNAKGAFGMLQFEHCERVLHALETVLDRVRRGECELDRGMLDAALSAVSALGRFVEGEENSQELNAAAQSFDPYLSGVDGAPAPRIQRCSFPISGRAEKRLEQARRSGAKTYVVNKLVGQGVSKQIYENLPVLADLKSAGAEVLAVWPPHEMLDAKLDQVPVQILCVSSLPDAQLAAGIFDTLVEVDFSPERISEPGRAAPVSGVSRPSPRFLIVEDEVVSRRLLSHMLAPRGVCDVVVDGQEAILSFILAIEEGVPYDMVFLDINLPRLDGRRTLRFLRRIEEERGLHITHPSRVVMTTALKDARNVLGSFREGCEGYLVKPFEREKLHELMSKVEADEISKRG